MFLKLIKSCYRNQRILEMYLACYTQQEIADDVGVGQPEVSKTINEFIPNGHLTEIGKLAEIGQSPESLPFMDDVPTTSIKTRVMGKIW